MPNESSTNIQDANHQPAGRTSKSIYLADGRRLGYADYGLKNGFPIIALHGTPGSRIWFEENDPISLELGIRLITVDRPGYGLSDPKKNRSIIDFNNDLNQLIDQLSLTNFSLFGVSGGGAYALAFASSNHSLLHKIGIVASAAEFPNGKAPTEMCRPNRIGFYFAKRLPWLLRFNYNRQKTLLNTKPELYIRSFQNHVDHLCQSDQDTIQNMETAWSMISHLREAFSQSSSETVSELRLLDQKWNIAFSKIQSVLEVWHGKADTLSPISGVRKMLVQVPNYHPNILTEKGHFLDEDDVIWRNILQSLISPQSP